MRGLIGGIVSGGLVSALALGTLSVVSEEPAGMTPPELPLVDAPEVAEVPATDPVEAEGPSTPVGSLSIEEPQAPALPEEEEASTQEPQAPADVTPEPEAPRADTDPLDEPEVLSIEGAMAAPETPEAGGVVAQPEAPVLPNPQALAPQTPESEADVTVSTAPAAPTVVVEPEAEENSAEEAPVVVVEPEAEPAPEAEAEDFFVVDLGTETEDAPADAAEDLALADPEADQPRFQLQGGENTLLGDRDTGVTVRRPGSDDAAEEAVEDVAVNALVDYAAPVRNLGNEPLMSIVLIDDGTMSAASAALSGLPFPVTIALDPAMPEAAALMQSYRETGFEVAVMAKLPEGAQPSDVEVTLQSVFQTLPESVAVLDIGEGGLQSDRDVTQQAMEVLAASGRGFVTVGQGLNMAGRAAEQAEVPAAIVYRDLDADGQDARVVRRFVDQAAFRARQESGVVLVGRVRPDTISALILWGTANQDAQVAIVPVSAVLTAQ